MRWHQSLITPGGPETIEQAARLLFGILAVLLLAAMAVAFRQATG
jgi:hypothetical protein